MPKSDLKPESHSKPARKTNTPQKKAAFRKPASQSRGAGTEHVRRKPPSADATTSPPVRRGSGAQKPRPASKPSRAAAQPVVGARTGEARGERQPEGEAMVRERPQRRALSHVGGRIEFRGAPELERACQQALKQRANEDDVRAHVHGFHPYPARLHPGTAHALITQLSRPGQTVLDPFCGSGTVLVEALLAGRIAWGTDLNPLATALAKTKCRGATADECESLLATAMELREFADERRKERAGPTRKYDDEERGQFDIHVLLELDSLRAGIEKLPAGARKLTLQLVLSSLLVKLSRKISDTVEHQTARRIAAGYPAKLFVKRTEEWIRQVREYNSLAPDTRPAYATWTCDARSLQPIDSASVDLVVTSPPYPGVYDYYAHHAMRLSWLDLKPGDFRSKEMGAKRNLTRTADPAAVWRKDLSAVLGELARVLRPGALGCIVMADTAIDGALLLADKETEQAMHRTELSVEAHAKQKRPLFHRASERAYQDRARYEHLLVLRRG